MSRTARIALGATLSGTMIAAVIAIASRPAPAPLADPLHPRSAPTGHPVSGRCRAVAAPDAACAAAWDAARRRFFDGGENP